TRSEEQDAPQACSSNPTEDTASPNPAEDIASQACDSDTETHHDPDNHGEALETLKETLAEQKQEMLNLKMELQGKDSQIQLLGKELHAYTTDALTPECLNNSHVPEYFHYCTEFTYDQFNSLYKEIFNQCNIIELLQGCIQCGYLKVGDGLMTDKGFLIEKEVEEIGLRLNIPPFARSNRQMPHADVEMTKKIDKHRVHVERLCFYFVYLIETVVLPIPTTMLGTALVLLLVYFFSSHNQECGKEPPGPRPLPLLGNILQLDLHKPYNTLCKFSKKYGSVFTVYFGPKKVVVLAGYTTVKQALINQAEEFGERQLTPAAMDISQGHGILFANGDSWKEMRRFALTNLRDFGMGKKAAEEKIIQECQYLIQEFEKYEGKAFDTKRPVNYASSNIISSIVYGSRFEYNDPQFQAMVDRASETIRITGTPAIQLYNVFPWLGNWVKSWRMMMKNIKMNTREIRGLIRHLKETLNPYMCRGIVDSFLIRKQKEENSGVLDSHYHEENLIFTVNNLFAAGTDTTGTTLRWGLLLMAKYPHIQ
ncbi:cytochrome P450 2K3-like, partial [Lampris incognitus]|uniref:cytochrome P450 2K3-like n=1 Tax=Lampris incognitus TaxID=2546036 RepID=UPI0024B57773